MKKNILPKSIPLFLAVIVSSVLLAGCGYSAKGLLPSYIKTVYVKPFTNNTYEVRLDTDVTTELINSFINDGNLKVAKEENADLFVTGQLVDFRREPLRYDVEREVEEYRIVILANIKVEDRRQAAVMWEEENFGGDTTYFISGSGAKTESGARVDAIKDFVRRIVNRTVEDW
ncbi:MAG: LptE family protein [Candidatus Omnitrophota bacterium]